MINPNRALTSGIPTKVAESISGTGTGNVRGFGVLKVGNVDANVTFQPVPQAGSITSLIANLESSVDGQTTWQVVTAIDFGAGVAKIANLARGLAYRLNFTTVTLVTGPVDVYATLS